MAPADAAKAGRPVSCSSDEAEDWVLLTCEDSQQPSDMMPSTRAEDDEEVGKPEPESEDEIVPWGFDKLSSAAGRAGQLPGASVSRAAEPPADQSTGVAAETASENTDAS